VPYFATSFRVLFHDTMAYGTHHFLTNFKFQCAAREEFLFGEVIKDDPQSKAALDEIVLVTQQAYSRNLAPVAVGETVGILLSYEEPTASSLRFCFRVVARDGKPVSCGFQTMVCLSRRTQAPVSPPSALLKYNSVLLERLEKPSFSERVLAGQLRDVFDPETVALGKGVAVREEGGNRIVGDPGGAAAPRDVDRLPLKLERGTVLLLPGQGSFHPALFAQLRRIDPNAESLFKRVDEIVRSQLGVPFAQLAGAPTVEAQKDILRQYPDLAQLGIYLAGVVSGRCLLNAGVKPDLLVGHSAGELAALALGGAYSVETGVEIVCHRIAALAATADVGGMLALGCDARRGAGLIDALGAKTLEVAVLNHVSQTVVSGTGAELEALERVAAHLGIACQPVQSRYPFHSQLMRPAVDRFASGLGELKVQSPEIPIYSPIQRSFYAAGDRLSLILPSHFVQSFAFFETVEELYKAGARTFVECGGGDFLTRLVRQIFVEKPEVRAFSTLPAGKLARPMVADVIGALRDAPAVDAPRVADAPVGPARGSLVGEVPIAIVALGCVLPGAADSGDLWRNVLDGTSGIRDGAKLAPEYAQAFLSSGDVVPDKTYTLLGGVIDRPSLAELPEGLRGLVDASSSARLLAASIMQCLAAVARRPAAERTHLFVGSTADGTLEHDEALLLEGLISLSNSLEQRSGAIAKLQEALRRVFAHPAESPWRLGPHPSISAVGEALIGAGTTAIAVDAACASSLYALGLAMGALRDGVCDAALAGGVFAPGPANSCLFSQFRGLSSTGSRPFDATADGVVFSSGVAIAMCKRLPDALRDGDRIVALLRGIGTSSDGKSSSVAEPKKLGQMLAIRRAYGDTSVDPGTIQYVEAHATSTPVGDAVEFDALNEIFRGHADGRTPIVLGSVKALIGHTGWAAGAASLAKVCHAFGERQLPPQANFTVPNPGIKLERSPFALLKSPQPWPRGAEPRRAGINGFGFGGTNAHLIVEEFDRGWHAAWRDAPPVSPLSTGPLAVVGVGALFPWKGEAKQLHFSPEEIRLPRQRPILPEVQEHMDRAQFLALLAADQALQQMGERWQTLRDDIAVVLGVQGKTARSLEATMRIYADFVRARLRDPSRGSSVLDQEFESCVDALIGSIHNSPPSNPYSLPGLMPNVVAGRVANFFDLHGANLVVDAGSSSLCNALIVAERMLRRGECKVVLAGAVNGNARAEASLIAGPDSAGRAVAEAALVLALVSLETAMAEKMEVRAVATFDSGPNGVSVGTAGVPYLMGAEGAWEVAMAIAGARDAATHLEWTSMTGPRRGVRFTASAESVAAKENHETSMKIRFAVPRLERIAPCAAKASPLSTKKLLVLAEQPLPAGLFSGVTHTLICPSGSRIQGAIPIDLSSDDSAVKSLAQLDGNDFDLILAFVDLSGADRERAIIEGARGRGLLELLMVAARRSYSLLQSGRCGIAAFAVSAWRDNELDPYTGLLGGFIKSLARELPGSCCKAVFSAATGMAALKQLEVELGEGTAAPIEVGYRDGDRYAVRLKEVPSPPRLATRAAGQHRVIVATGGARGVTAALIEAVIEKDNCNVVVLGRTDPEALPTELRDLDEAAFEAREPDFYKDEVARRPGARVVELRERWGQYRAAREVRATLAQLRAGGARVEYLRVDITDQAAVDHAVQEIVRKHGRIDLVLHGAGIQASQQLSRKKLTEFRRVVATKLGGLWHLRESCARHLPGHPLNFHLVTSAFSFFGNDGQPDYGAANQAMDRLVLSYGANGAEPIRWSSMAWLGWANVGMTRGSEYASLARRRGLRPIRRNEGKALFAEFLDHLATSRNIVQVSEGELRFYGVDLDPVNSPADAHGVTETEQTWELSTSKYGFLADHRANGVPTVPGTFELELAVCAALSLRPSRRVVTVEQAVFDRFVKVQDGTTVSLRSRSRLIEENDKETIVEVSLHSDFVHKSGLVLQRDIRHFAACVRLADQPLSPPRGRIFVNGAEGISAADPYLAADSPIRLGGLFHCLQTIRLHSDHRTASFHITCPDGLPQLDSFNTPFLLLDAMTRCAALNVEPDGAMQVWVPVSARRTLLPYQLNDSSLHAGGAEVRINAVAPRLAGDLVSADYVEAVDANGGVIVVVEGLVARKIGSVHV